jgi:hypothetical protein
MGWRELTINYVKDLLRAKTPLEVAEKELVEAQHSKMQGESAVEYAQSIVAYNEKRIFRLTNLIAELNGEYYDR